MNCRFCRTDLNHVFVDLGSSPPSNSFLTPDEVSEEDFYPLKGYVCEKCYLVQIDEFKSAKDIFCDTYVYFSSYSKSWLEHSKSYVDMISDRLNLNAESMVIEIASNDGYLLQYFKEKGIPCLGIEPTKNTARVAIDKGIETLCEFFGRGLAGKLKEKGYSPNLMLGNNVLAHVPDVNDFVGGVSLLLDTKGTVTFEFPHLARLIENNQFDTIYHEHFSYFSLYTVDKIFKEHGLRIYDVQEITTHGGSLRIFACHDNNNELTTSPKVNELLKSELDKGVDTLEYYSGFQKVADDIKSAFTTFLREQKAAGKKVAGYGAAAKGNTLLNFCNVKNDMIEFVVDASPHKQNLVLPGSHIPVKAPDEVNTQKPDFLVIFPWNIKEEIVNQMSHIRSWGGQFVTCIPQLKIF